MKRQYSCAAHAGVFAKNEYYRQLHRHLYNENDWRPLNVRDAALYYQVWARIINEAIETLFKMRDEFSGYSTVTNLVIDDEFCRSFTESYRWTTPEEFGRCRYIRPRRPAPGRPNALFPNQ